jgi:inosine-uridine nucleoside N-ribohydrolase
MSLKFSPGAVSSLALAILILIALALGSLAIPVASWRSGEVEAPRLDIRRSQATSPTRLWIDTDAACGLESRVDPDDCLALLSISRAGTVNVAGISTVFGNADLEVTDTTTRALVNVIRAAGLSLPDVVRGAESALPRDRDIENAAADALAAALREGPLTILALGPVTNIASALQADPSSSENLQGVVAVMGRRPGHLFHPSEGQGDGILFGHGPVFSDLNFRKDPAAVAFLVSSGVPLTLIPYEAARDVIFTPTDMTRLAESGPPGEWIARRATGWMDFWQKQVGIDGFYPFDFVAAQFVLDPTNFYCATVYAWVETGWAPDWLWMLDDAGLLVGPRDAGADRSTVTYCPEVGPNGDFARFLARAPAMPFKRSVIQSRVKQ